MEFKESLKLRDDIGETVSTFSNSDGGTVMVGVSGGDGIHRSLTNIQVSFLPPEAIEYLIIQKSEPKRQRHP